MCERGIFGDVLYLKSIPSLHKETKGDLHDTHAITLMLGVYVNSFKRCISSYSLIVLKWGHMGLLFYKGVRLEDSNGCLGGGTQCMSGLFRKFKWFLLRHISCQNWHLQGGKAVWICSIYVVKHWGKKQNIFPMSPLTVEGKCLGSVGDQKKMMSRLKQSPDQHEYYLSFYAKSMKAVSLHSCVIFVQEEDKKSRRTYFLYKIKLNVEFLLHLMKSFKNEMQLILFKAFQCKNNSLSRPHHRWELLWGQPAMWLCLYSKILLDESKCWVALNVELMLVTVGEEEWLLICSNSFSLWLSADCTLAVGH